jgi:hypothetical protein
MGDRNGGRIGDDREAARREVLFEKLPGDRFAGGIEILERFVQEEKPRPVKEGPAPAQALPHSRGEGAGEPVGRQAHPGEELGPARRRDTPETAEEGEILGRRQLLVKGEVGSDEPHPPPPLDGILALPRLPALDLSLVRGEEPGEALQERALARAVAAGDEEHLAVRHLAAHPGEDRQPPEATGDAFETDLVLRHRVRSIAATDRSDRSDLYARGVGNVR